MDPSKLDNIKKYGFFQKYVKDQDEKDFLAALQAFRNDKPLELGQDDITQVQKYFIDRKKTFKTLNTLKGKFKLDVEAGQIEPVCADVKTYINTYRQAETLVKTFNPIEFRQSSNGLEEMFKELEKKHYPRAKLQELMGQATAKTCLNR
jgi:hypothetical protein